MIVLPRLLSDLLDEVDEARADHLALDFVQHVVEIEADEITEPVMISGTAFIRAAHEAIDLGEVHSRFFEMRERFFEAGTRWEGHRYAFAVGGGADSACHAGRH